MNRTRRNLGSCKALRDVGEKNERYLGNAGIRYILRIRA
jgi:hypothetical protein